MKQTQTGIELRHENAVIFVPRAGSRLDQEIVPGSGIVGVMRRSDVATPIVYVIYYEGNLYSAANLGEPSQRVICAFSRAAVGYPTSAMRGVMPDEVFDLVRVGEIQYPDIIRWDTPASALVFLEYMGRYQGKESATNRHGVSSLSVIEMNMTSLLGTYENPRDFEEWRWLEAFSRFAHVGNDVEEGVFEFMLKISLDETDNAYETPPPAKIKAVIDLARQINANWIMFHQG